MEECARDQTTKGLLPAKMTARVPFTHSPFACYYWVGVGATLSPFALLPLQPSDQCMLILLRPSWYGRGQSALVMTFAGLRYNNVVTKSCDDKP